MSNILDSIKNHVSDILGLAIMLLAVSCYFFDVPQERNEIVNSIEFGAGIVLVWTPVEKIAADLWEILKKKLQGGK